MLQVGFSDKSLGELIFYAPHPDVVSYPRATVKLATKLSPADCDQLALGYVNPGEIDITEWQGREAEGILYVPKAGEMLYRVRVGVV
jgi:hypothetical protein